MLLKKESLLEATPPARPHKLRWNVLLGDLSFFACVWLAQFMVWRMLRRQRRERADRLKWIKLVPDANPGGDKSVVVLQD